MSNSDTVSTIYNARNNLMKLLYARGYDISDYDEFSITDVNLMYQNKQLDLLLSKREDQADKKKIYVKYFLDKVLRPVNIEELTDDLINLEKMIDKTDDLLIISVNDPNDTINALIKEIWETKGIYIGIIGMKRLCFNILEHSLVPPHKVLSNNEKVGIKNKYNIKDDKMFPEISRLDPVAIAIGLRPTEVCEITRSSKNSVTSMYYRICA